MGWPDRLGQVSEESKEPKESNPRLEINPIQVMASALAAVTSAVLLSTLGTAGTIIGAALGSLIATAGAAIYSYSIRISRERVAAVQAAAIAKVNRKRTGASTRQIEVEEKHGDQGRALWREALARLPWKWIAIIAGAVFVIAMIVIISFELITGRSVSTVTGGTDGGGHRTTIGLGHPTKVSKSKSPSPSPSPSTSTTPKASSTTHAPGSTSRPSPGVTKSAVPTTPTPSLPTESSSPSRVTQQQPLRLTASRHRPTTVVEVHRG